MIRLVAIESIPIATNDAATEFEDQDHGTLLFTSGPLRTITDAPNAPGPSLLTTAEAHGFRVGETVVIASVTGNTAMNGRQEVLTVPTPDTFTIRTAGNGGYTGGGNVTGRIISQLRVPLADLGVSQTKEELQALIEQDGAQAVSLTLEV